MRPLVYNALLPLKVAGTVKDIVQGESLLSAPKPSAFPLLVYRLGNETNENLAETSTAHRVFFQVYVHDRPADYSGIDALMVPIRDLLLAAAPAGHVLQIMWRENSRDLDDEFLGSIMRYMRFEAALAQ